MNIFHKFRRLLYSIFIVIINCNIAFTQHVVKITLPYSGNNVKKELYNSDTIKTNDLTKDQMIAYNTQAARIKPWEKQFQYDPNYIKGLQVSQDSVKFIFNYLKNDLLARTDEASLERYWELDNQPIFEEHLLVSLSYLAQQGNVEIENALLKNYEYAFGKYFDQYKKYLLPTPANGFNAISFQA